jgi:hypothetical protein
VLPSISETIGGTKEERTMIIALDGVNCGAAHAERQTHAIEICKLATRVL